MTNDPTETNSSLSSDTSPNDDNVMSESLFDSSSTNDNDSPNLLTRAIDTTDDNNEPSVTNNEDVGNNQTHIGDIQPDTDVTIEAGGTLSNNPTESSITVNNESTLTIESGATVPSTFILNLDDDSTLNIDATIKGTVELQNGNSKTTIDITGINLDKNVEINVTIDGLTGNDTTGSSEIILKGIKKDTIEDISYPDENTLVLTRTNKTTVTLHIPNVEKYAPTLSYDDTDGSLLYREGKANIVVSSGTIYSSGNISSGDTLVIESGGIANNGTDPIHIENGASLITSDLVSGNNITLDSGSTVENPLNLRNGASLTIEKGKKVNKVITINGGTIDTFSPLNDTSSSLSRNIIWSGGGQLTLESGATYIHDNTSPYPLPSNTNIYIKSGATYNNIGVVACNLHIESGGILKNDTDKAYASSVANDLHSGTQKIDVDPYNTLIIGKLANVTIDSGATIPSLTLLPGGHIKIDASVKTTIDLGNKSNNGGVEITGINPASNPTINVQFKGFGQNNADGSTDQIHLDGISKDNIKEITYPDPDTVCLNLNDGHTITLHIKDAQKYSNQLENDINGNVIYEAKKVILVSNGHNYSENVKAGEYTITDPKTHKTTILQKDNTGAGKDGVASGYTLQIESGGVANNIHIKSGASLASPVDGSDLTLINGNTITLDSGSKIDSPITLEKGANLTVSNGFNTQKTITLDGGNIDLAGNTPIAWTASGGTVTLENGVSFTQTNIASSDPTATINFDIKKGGSFNAPIQSGYNITVEAGGSVKSADSSTSELEIPVGATVTVAKNADVPKNITLADNSHLSIDASVPTTVNLGDGDENTSLEITGLDPNSNTNTDVKIAINGFSGQENGSSDQILLKGITANDIAYISYPDTDKNAVILTCKSGKTITLHIPNAQQTGYKLTDINGELAYGAGSNHTIIVHNGETYSKDVPKDYTIVIESGGIVNNIHINAGATLVASDLVKGNAITLDAGSIVENPITLKNGANLTVAQEVTLTQPVTLDGGSIDLHGNAPISWTANGGTINLADGASFTQPNTPPPVTAPVTFNVNDKGNFNAPILAGYIVNVATGGNLNPTASEVHIPNDATVTIAKGAHVSPNITMEDNAHLAIDASVSTTVDMGNGDNSNLEITGIDKSAVTDVNITIKGFSGNSPDGSDKIHLQGITPNDIKSVTYPSSGDTVVLTLQNGKTVTLHIPDVQKFGFQLAADSNGDVIYEVCFLSGTLIKTPTGEVAVEELEIGDMVITHDPKTGNKVETPLVWVGSQHNQLHTDLPDDMAGYPVCILKHALADNVPHTDLWVTPEHCLFLEGCFIPVRMLVNGRSIFYDFSKPSYQYYHIETEKHSIIIANGALTESYLDTGNRKKFKQSHKIISLLHGHPKQWNIDTQVPLATQRTIVEPLHQQILQRAEALQIGKASIPPEVTNDPDLHLVTDSGIILNKIHNIHDKHVFILPPDVQSVTIMSRSSRPNEAIGAFIDDRRKLGVLIGEITLSNSQTTYSINTHLTNDNLKGWNMIETSTCRWTKGDAHLPLTEYSFNNPTYLVINILAGGPYIIAKKDKVIKIA